MASVITRMTRFAFIALSLVVVAQVSGCWLADKFPVPQGSARIQLGTPEDTQTVYKGIVDHLRELGFVDQHHQGSLFGKKSSEAKYWTMFDLTEPDGLGVSLAIDMDTSENQVIYQYSEHKQGSEFKDPPIPFSSNACKILADINSFAAEISITHAYTDDIRFWGPEHCGVQ